MAQHTILFPRKQISKLILKSCIIAVLCLFTVHKTILKDLLYLNLLLKGIQCPVGRLMYWTPQSDHWTPPPLKSDDLFLGNQEILDPPLKNPGHAPDSSIS